MKIDCAFSRLHPLTLLSWFAVVLSVTVFTVNPVFALVSLLGAVIYSFAGRAGVSFPGALSQLLFMAAVTLINPIVSHHGTTVLFFLHDLPVTLEALLFGALMSVIITSSIRWCGVLSTCMTSDKVIYLCGRVFPRLAVLISLTLRFIPLIKDRYKRISDAQRMLLPSSDKIISRLRLMLSTVSALITMVLEESIDTADSMRARGIGLKCRTSYSDFKFGTLVLIITLYDIIAAVYLIVIQKLGGTYFAFYPRITVLPSASSALGAYIVFLVLILIPTFTEVRVWKRSALKT